METCLSTKGQLVLPSSVRRQLGLRNGDAFDVIVDAAESRIILTLKKQRPSLIIATDPLTGYPVLTIDPRSSSDPLPVLTSGEVEDILAGFP